MNLWLTEYIRVGCLENIFPFTSNPNIQINSGSQKLKFIQFQKQNLIFLFLCRENDHPQRRRRSQRSFVEAPLVSPPHICIKSAENETVIDKCLVYTKAMKSLTIEAKLKSATNQGNESNPNDWCSYPIGKVCLISNLQKKKGKKKSQNLIMCRNVNLL